MTTTKEYDALVERKRRELRGERPVEIQRIVPVEGASQGKRKGGWPLGKKRGPRKPK